MANPQILAGIMNPAIAEPVTGFGLGRERRQQGLADEQVGMILNETIGGKIGALAELDPELSLQLAEAFQIPVGQQDRLKSMIGDVRSSAAILREAGPQAAAQFLGEKTALLDQLGIDAPQYLDMAQRLGAGDPTAAEELLTLDGAFSQLSNKEAQLQSSKTLPDGTSVQTFKDGRVRVVGPDNQEITGDAARQAVREAEEFGVDIQTGRARGRTAATEEEKRASTLIEQGTLAAESTAGLRRGIDLLKRIETGGIDAVRIRAKQAFGIETADEAELTNELATAVLSQLRETFGAQFTEREGERLERIEAGLGKSTAGNIRLLNQALGIAERKAQRAIKAARRRDQTDVVDDIQGLLDTRISDPEGPTGAAPRVGRFQIEVVTP